MQQPQVSRSGPPLARRSKGSLPARAYPFPERVDEDEAVDAEREADAEGAVDGDQVLVEPHRPRGPARARVRAFRRRRRDAEPPPPPPPHAGDGGGVVRAGPGWRPRVRPSGAAAAASGGGGGRNGEGRRGEEVQVGRHGRSAGWGSGPRRR